MKQTLQSQNNDDTLLRQFFDQHKLDSTLTDNGFSHRVMQRLPQRTPLWARLWSPCCCLMSIALFIHLRGFQQVWHALREIFTNQAEQLVPQQFDPKVWLVAGGVLLFLVYRKLSQMA